MRSILFSILLSLCVHSVAFAQKAPDCSDSPFTILDNTVKYGASKKSVKDALRKKFKTAQIIETGDANNMLLVSLDKPYNNLEAMVYLFNQDALTRIMYTYADQFWMGLGGHVELFEMLKKRLKEKHGENTDVSFDTDNGKAIYIWTKGPMTVRLIGQDKPYKAVQMRFDCDALEKHLQDKAQKSVNFGF